MPESCPVKNYRMELYTFKGNKFIPSILNQTFEFCDYFDKPMSQMLLHIIYPILQKGGKMPEKCPVRPDSYYLHNVTLPDNKFFPSGRYRVDFTLYVSNKRIARFNTIVSQNHNIG
ncbi:uncharacterized protein LOC113385847 [Ctenocephalides felis]|uniref:uncharacterized protein LOC113385847 n=1 Tax=Ctenocephalides felis TaxID=7515 RepID=UPI000E6E3805|nr:uncharacterized protein LOC113385847 [Ctenocephalides felis]